MSEEEITLILISEDEWNLLRNRTQPALRYQKELDVLSDTFFSDPDAWTRILERVLKLEPKSVGVSFFMSDGPVTNFKHPTLNDPRVFWPGRVSEDLKILRPRMFAVSETNFGILDLKLDSDGILRRAVKPTVSHLSLGALIAESATGRSLPDENHLINFRGPSGSFLTFSLSELLYGNLPEPAVHGRVVLIGAKAAPTHMVVTPQGPMPKVEALANIVSNLMYQQKIVNLPFFLSVAILAALLLVSILIVTRYSQTVALVMLILIWITYAAFSAWTFDSLNTWIPLVAPSIQLLITFIVFISFQLLLNEQETWRLQQEKRYLKEVEEVKTNFLSLVSHDLKTPLAKIQAVADRLLAGSAPNQVQEDAKIVRRSTQELNRYIQSLLQVTRVESTHFEVRKTPADINELIQKVVEDLRPLANEKSIRIRESLEPLFSVELDTTLIYEVLLNLLENAIKYTPTGGSVEVQSQEVENEVLVTVSDTGEGIPPEEQGRVWDKFYRGRKHDTTTKGSGLGLYLSKFFIQLHGGRVFLSSTPGHGTKIGFALPITGEGEPEERS